MRWVQAFGAIGALMNIVRSARVETMWRDGHTAFEVVGNAVAGPSSGATTFEYRDVRLENLKTNKVECK